MVLLVVFGWLSVCIWNDTARLEDRLKNSSLVFTGGTVIIGIFYSIINYEHNKIKFNHDKKSSRDILTFNTASKMHDVNTLNNFRKVDVFFKDNEVLFNENRCSEIKSLFDNNPDLRASFVSVMNYLEGISLGISQEIMDETFMMNFFKSIFSLVNKWRK